MIKYRPEIDGLRAIAVLAVIFYHIGIRCFDGGFVGVDIFFVISGFLITSIIKNEIEVGTFSFLHFYERRIRRIIPSLSIVLIATSFVAYLYLLPLDFVEYSQSLLFSNLFISNVLFWQQSGYFDSAAELKPLLHTWSLSVEEQFYIFFPFLLLLIKDQSYRIRLLTLISLCSLSFLLCLITLEIKPSAAYYLLPFRAWELLIGGIAAYIYKEKHYRSIQYNLISIVGFGLIIFSILTIDRNEPFPKFTALMPTIGAALILLFAQKGTFVQRLLSTKLLVAIGLVSYSAYLWHQPTIIFSRYYFGLNWDVWGILAALIFILVISGISWKLVEQPFRQSHLIGRYHVFLLFGFSTLLFITIGQLGIKNKGYPERLGLHNIEIQKLASITDPYDHFDYKANVRDGSCHSISTEDFFKNRCLDIRKNNIFIVGDSYAASLYPGLELNRDKNLIDIGLTQLTEGNAPPFVVKGNGDTGKSLSSINEFRIDTIVNHKPNIILMHWMPGGSNTKIPDLETLKKIEDQITVIKKVSPLTKIFIIGPPPKWNISLQRQMISYSIKYKEVPPRYMNFGQSNDDFELENFLKKTFTSSDVKYISLREILCNSEGCLTRTSDEYSDLTAVDWGHLTRNGSIFVADRILPIIISELKTKVYLDSSK